MTDNNKPTTQAPLIPVMPVGQNDPQFVEDEKGQHHKTVANIGGTPVYWPGMPTHEDYLKEQKAQMDTWVDQAKHGFFNDLHPKVQMAVLDHLTPQERAAITGESPAKPSGHHGDLQRHAHHGHHGDRHAHGGHHQLRTETAAATSSHDGVKHHAHPARKPPSPGSTS